MMQVMKFVEYKHLLVNVKTGNKKIRKEIKQKNKRIRRRNKKKSNLQLTSQITQ